MNRWIDIKVTVLIAAAALAGCEGLEETIGDDSPVTVDLAFAFASSNAGSVTRQATDVVQSDNTFRQVNMLRFVPTRSGNVVRSEFGDQQGPTGNKTGEKIDDDHTGTAQFYHIEKCDLSQGVDGCMAYAKAIDNMPTESGVTSKAYNGSLTETLPVVVTSTDQVSFEPEVIYGNAAAPAAANTLANALTNIANVDQWKYSNNATLKSLFQNFTNHGYNLAGSAANVIRWVAALRAAVQTIINNPPPSVGNTEQLILNNIIKQIDQRTSISGSTYPRSFILSDASVRSLPDGAAVLRWTSSGFVPRMTTTTLDPINTVSRFVYPAPLYYYVESDIRTSEEERTLNDYDKKSKWDDVLSTYFTNGNRVMPSTRAVALVKPLQYAVAQLKVTVRATAEKLEDYDGTPITVGTNNFPLTGVLVSGQHKVGYDFTPVSDSEVDVKFVYDSQVKTNGDDYFYLQNTTPTDGPRTLLLQNIDGEAVTLILEFENNGTEAFRCINGMVYPGTRFYLIGRIEPDAKIAGDEKSGRVFTKDYTTLVKAEVASLAKAYNVLPNILTENLEIGVETTPNWVAATPNILRLE